MPDVFGGNEGTEFLFPGRDMADITQWYGLDETFNVCFHSFLDDCNDKCGKYNGRGKRVE